MVNVRTFRVGTNAIALLAIQAVLLSQMGAKVYSNVLVKTCMTSTHDRITW
jgi:hypothetical protein